MSSTRLPACGHTLDPWGQHCQAWRKARLQVLLCPDFRSLPKGQAAGVERRACVNRVDLSQSLLVCACLLGFLFCFVLFGFRTRRGAVFSPFMYGQEGPSSSRCVSRCGNLRSNRPTPLPLSSATCLVAKPGFLTPRLRKWFKHPPSSPHGLGRRMVVQLFPCPGDPASVSLFLSVLGEQSSLCRLVANRALVLGPQTDLVILGTGCGP